MRTSTLLMAALAPVRLLADNAPFTVSPPGPELNLDEYLAKNNLAIVPRDELTEALSELTSLLREQKAQQQRPRVALKRRQNGTGGNGTTPSAQPSQPPASQPNAQPSAQPNSRAGTQPEAEPSSTPSSTPQPEQPAQDDGDDSSGDSPIQIQGLDDLGGLLDGLTDLLGGLGDIPDLIKAISGLLSDEFLQALHDAMIYLSETLQPPIPKIARSLLQKAEPLIDMLDDIGLEDILNELKNADLPGLIKAVVPLLNEKNVKNIEGLLTNGAALLTPSFVNQTSSLINDVSPLISDLSPLLDDLRPLLQKLTDIDLEGETLFLFR